MHETGPVVTPAQAAHQTAMQPHRNGALNLAKAIPEFLGKVLGPWLRRAPEDGPGLWRYAETPGVTAGERAAIEPPQRNSALMLPASSPAARIGRVLDSIRSDDAAQRGRGGEHQRE